MRALTRFCGLAPEFGVALGTAVVAEGSGAGAAVVFEHRGVGTTAGVASRQAGRYTAFAVVVVAEDGGDGTVLLALAAQVLNGVTGFLGRGTVKPYQAGTVERGSAGVGQQP